MSSLTDGKEYRNRPVPVVASFTSNGQIVPLYIRVDGISLKVQSCREKPSFMGSTDYACNIITQDSRIVPVTMKYLHVEHVWIMDIQS